MRALAKRTALLALCLALAVMAGCSAAPQRSQQGQPESSPSSAAASEHADTTTSSGAGAGAGKGEPAGSSGSSITATEGAESSTPGKDDSISDHVVLEANGSELSVVLADTDAARALAGKLADGPITLELSAYGGFEKAGPLGFPLPASDAQVTVQPGDVMLYQGSQVSVFTGSNTYVYTRLGHVEGATADELAAILGDGDVTATLTLG